MQPQPPKLQFTYWSEKVGLHSKWCPPQNHPPIDLGEAAKQDPRGFVYSSDGRYLAVKCPTHVSILETDGMTLVSILKMVWVSQIAFSPQSNFVCTWTPSDRAGGAEVKNLGVYNLKTGEMLVGWALRRKLSWPLVQWSSDELIVGVLLQLGKVNFYIGTEFSVPVQAINQPGLTHFFMGPGKTTNVSVFVPNKASTPAALLTYEYPKLNKELLQKVSFFADSVEVMWNESGNGMLLISQTEVDTSNYYGKKGLFFINVATKYFSSVTDEFVHDVQWNPNSTEFSVIYGAMPYPKVSLFNMKCQKTADLVNGEEARNKLLYDPHGRMLCVGGFGSLNGDMDFWDLTKPELKKVGRANAFAAAHQEWCPDSRHFMACVIMPRMKMDNGIKVFNYHGELVYEEKVLELYQCNWRPCIKGAHPPKEIEPAKKLKSGQLSTAEPPKYRPPHAVANQSQSALDSRGRGGPVRYTPGGTAVRGTIGGGNVVGGTPKQAAPKPAANPTVPGQTAPAGQGLSKNAKKNAKKRAAKAAAEAAAGDGTPDQS